MSSPVVNVAMDTGNSMGKFVKPLRGPSMGPMEEEPMGPMGRQEPHDDHSYFEYLSVQLV